MYILVYHDHTTRCGLRPSHILNLIYLMINIIYNLYISALSFSSFYFACTPVAFGMGEVVCSLLDISLQPCTSGGGWAGVLFAHVVV